MATATPVSVFARVRPLRTGDTAVTVQHQHATSADGSALAVPRGIVLSGGSAGRQHSFEFTRVFAAEAPQEEVYLEAVKPLVQAFLSGVSGTAMAYGQTGSGKTYTMLGGSKYKTRGLIPRAINDVFASLDREEKAAAAAALAAPVSDSVAGGADAAPPGDGAAGAGCKLLCAYTQVYNEALYDLLEEGNADKPIELWDRVRVQEGRDGALLLSNLRQFEVPTERDALNLMFLGNVRRMTAETPMNAASSRSHCIFTLTLERSLPDGRLRTSKLHLVDLAGSERIRDHGSAGAAVDARAIARRGRQPSLGGGGAEAADGDGGSGGGRSSRARSVSANGEREARSRLRREGRYINLSLHHLEQVVLALHAAQLQALAQAQARAAAEWEEDEDDAASGAGSGRRTPSSSAASVASGRGRGGGVVSSILAVANRGRPGAGGRDVTASSSRGGGDGGDCSSDDGNAAFSLQPHQQQQRGRRRSASVGGGSVGEGGAAAGQRSRSGSRASVGAATAVGGEGRVPLLLRPGSSHSLSRRASSVSAPAVQPAQPSSRQVAGAAPTILTDDAALLLASGPPSRRSSGVAASLGGPQPGAGHQRNLSRLSAGGPGMGGGPGSISSAGRASAAPQAAVHVPYRNSVLTSVLRDSLGGNCRTVLLATLNPEPDFAEESLSTCRFAARCGMLVNAVSAREEETAASAAAEQRALVAAYKSRVRELLAALDRQSVATSEREAALREAASALLRAGQELPPSLSLALAGADSGDGATPTAGGSASRGSVLDCSSPGGSVSAASVPLNAAGAPTPCSRCAASAAAAALSPAPVPDAARRHEIEAGVAACIRAGLDPDQHPGAEAAEGLRAVVAQHLSLRSVPEGYAALELLLQALQRAVAAAGEASSEADHARAQAKALQAAVASLQGVAARLQRDCGDWETRHAGLMGEFAVMQRATAALTAQVVELQAQLAQSTDRAAAAQAAAASAVAERDAARAAAAEAQQRLAAAAESAAETARPRVRVSAADPESATSSVSAADAGSATNATEGAMGSDAAAADPPLSGRRAEGASAQAHGAVPSEAREGTLKSVEPASGGLSSTAAMPHAIAPLLTAPPPEPAIASASRASATAVRQLLLAGGLFMKHGRRGAPHMRFVWCDGDLLAVHWTAVDTAGRSGAGPAASAASSSSSTGRGSLLLSSVCEVVAGRRTAVFGRGSGGRTGRDAACFSLVAPDRTLDLEVALPDSYAYAGALAASGALGGLSSPSGRKELDGEEEGQGLQSGAGALPAGVDAAVSAAETALRDRWVKAFRIVIAARRKLEKGLPSPSGSVPARA